MNSLEDWIDAQYHHCAQRMLRGISATDIIKQRPGFGQSIQAHVGSVVASPVLADYDPDPDYFFHWYRDSAVVMMRCASCTSAARWVMRPCSCSNSSCSSASGWMNWMVALWSNSHCGVNAFSPPSFSTCARRLICPRRTASVSRGETRVNADGRLDISSWPRPQHDGIATRALTVTRWLQLATLEPAVREAATRLLKADLHYTRRHWPTPSYDIWEEDLGLHYYTLCTAAAALGDDPACEAIHRMLDTFWDCNAGHYRSRALNSGAPRPSSWTSP